MTENITIRDFVPGHTLADIAYDQGIMDLITAEDRIFRETLVREEVARRERDVEDLVLGNIDRALVARGLHILEDGEDYNVIRHLRDYYRRGQNPEGTGIRFSMIRDYNLVIDIEISLNDYSVRILDTLRNYGPDPITPRVDLMEYLAMPNQPAVTGLADTMREEVTRAMAIPPNLIQPFTHTKQTKLTQKQILKGVWDRIEDCIWEWKSKKSPSTEFVAGNHEGLITVLKWVIGHVNKESRQLIKIYIPIAKDIKTLRLVRYRFRQMGVRVKKIGNHNVFISKDGKKTILEPGVAFYVPENTKVFAHKKPKIEEDAYQLSLPFPLEPIPKLKDIPLSGIFNTPTIPYHWGNTGSFTNNATTTMTTTASAHIGQGTHWFTIR